MGEEADAVNHPPHYVSHPSGIECIQITEHMGFNLGNAVKYIWRADLKGAAVEDLRKAAWYVEREIALRESCPRCHERVPEDGRYVDEQRRYWHAACSRAEAAA